MTTTTAEERAAEVDADPGDEAAGRPAPLESPVAALPRGRVEFERLVLMLVATLTLATLISWRYHSFFGLYGRFVATQALPATGLDGELKRELPTRPQGLEGELRNLANPYWPQSTPKFGTLMNPVGSDYLAVWHFVRQTRRGINPYAQTEPVLYNLDEVKPLGVEVVHDPAAPRQMVAGKFSYLPMGLAALLPFYRSNYFESLALYLGVVHLAFYGLAAWAVVRCKGNRGPALVLAGAVALSAYPLDFLADRGNIEGVVFLLVAAGLLAYRSGLASSSAVLLGLAASPKLAPLVFLGLFVLDRKPRAFALGLATAVGSNLAALAFLHERPVTLVGQIVRNFSEFGRESGGLLETVRYDHSAFNMARGALAMALGPEHIGELSGLLAGPYLVATLVAAAAVTVRLAWMPGLNRVLVLTAMMLAFPYVSGDYKLIHLYPAFGLLVVCAARRGWATRPEAAATLLLALLFVPKTYMLPLGQIYDGFGFLLNGSTLLALIALGLTARLGAAHPTTALTI